MAPPHKTDREMFETETFGKLDDRCERRPFESQGKDAL